MGDPFFSLRQTGRTHRMLQEAIAQARSGRHVVVVAGGNLSAIRDQALHMLGSELVESSLNGSLMIRLGEKGGAIHFVGGAWLGVDIDSKRVDGFDRENVLVDHSAYEKRHEWILREWMRWVQPTPGSGEDNKEVRS